jgi:hypothetical protein
MSYDLTFYNKKNMTAEEVEEFFVNETIVKEIDSKKKLKIIEELKKENLQFEIEDLENDIELNFETYQISIFNNEISISIPYWKENSDKKVVNEINTICSILLKNDMTGYDLQSEIVFNEEIDFGEMYDANFEAVSHILNDITDEEINPRRRKILLIVGFSVIGLAIFGLIQLIKLLALLIKYI